VPRQPRCHRQPGSLEPGRLYHITNRGVDRCPIFHSDLDRILFLSMLAETCLRFGAVCHAWCLMSTHFHLVLEDCNGMLSQLMHRLGSTYARYFNDTRRRPRGGPLFESRFRAELIDTATYFEDACAYVLLNPLQTKTPLASSAEAYPWSSAALICSDLSPAASIAALLDRLGGADAVLAALPPASRKSSRDLRRARLDALTSGAWLEREHLLAGRSPEHYRRVLAARAARGSAPARQPDLPSAPAQADAGPHRAALAARPPFAGFEAATVLGRIHAACDQLIPVSLAAPERRGELLVYVMHRFTRATIAELAELTGTTVERVRTALERVRAQRVLSVAWQRVLWGVEWALRWSLLAAPHRP
jgi:REP element-mobilizing transposase RayT